MPKTDKTAADLAVVRMSDRFRLWVQYRYGYVQVICERCNREVTALRTNVHTGQPMDDTPLLDCLRAHRCKT
jgi:hypothetical protein